MSIAQAQNRLLRLVPAEAAHRARLSAPAAQPRTGTVIPVQTANRPLLQSGDARWVLAVQAAASIQGGRAAVLSPERRRRLQAIAANLGLRPFDATLVLAVVQDAARTGSDPLNAETEQRLALIRPAEPGATDRERVLTMATASLALGAAMFAALLAWVGAI